MEKEGVGYVRRSTDRQEQSLEDQRKSIIAKAAELGYRIDNWFEDDAVFRSHQAHKPFH